ncbi:MAG: Bax inhibitor-1/YccA family protein [Xanthobacteraceae bacterium]|nr:MAG: Bax inhibitor-1/YccA family protein [Xanthobacteraceae bacterium]
MSDLNNNPAARYGGAVRTGAEIDQGLRSYMLGVYNYMTIGLAITGLFALGIYMLSVSSVSVPGAVLLRAGMYLTPFGQTLFLSPLKYVIIFAPLALVFFLSFRVDKMSVGAAQLTYWIYAALVGVSLATILMVYTHTSVARVFFITAASFGALSLYGYTTKRDLSGMATFLVMGLIGVIIASIVNIFLGSSMLQWIVSIVGLLVFAGFTAYDTQDIKNMYDVNDDGTVAGRKSIMGALRLYLDFLNIFLFLLQLLGNRE